MVRVKVLSDKSLRQSSIIKIKNILENSTDLQTDLTNAFPRGFTKFNKRTFTLTLGEGSNVVRYIDIKGFQPGVIRLNNGECIVNKKYEVDY